jgi:hypothetical protein
MWHGLGYVSQEDLTAMEALTKIDGGYFFEKRPVKTFFNGKEQEIPDQFAIVRSASSDDPNERIVDFATGGYHILQPLDAVNLYDERVKQPVETLGFLGHGEKMFLTWRMKEFEVKKDDVVKPYGFLALGFDTMLGAQLSIVETRVVCQNTWNAALSEADSDGSKKRNMGKVWTGKHTSPNMMRDLGAWMEHVQQRAEEQVDYLQKMFNAFANYKMEKDEAYDILYNSVYTIPSMPTNYPRELLNEKLEDIDKKTEWSEKSVDMVMDLFCGNGIAIDATAWGLFNATVEAENHHRSVRKDPSNSILFGARAQAMNRMAVALAERVNL